MTKDEALKLVLDVLVYASSYCDTYDAIEVIKEALAQPKRPWVGLTDALIDRVTTQCFGPNADLEFHGHHARAIETKLKELNT